MTVWLFALRTLRSQWRLGALTAFCVAVSASVLVGAMAVGDSVRGSLWRRLAVPLGEVTHALASPGPIDVARAREGVSATLRMVGSASNQSEETSGNVTVWGIDGRFGELVSGRPETVRDGEAWITPALARAIGLAKGDPLFLRLPKLASPPPQSVFSPRKPSDATLEAVATVAGVLPDSGIGRFSLDPSFRPLRSVIVSRAWLGAQVGARKDANVFLGTSNELVKRLDLADLGLRLIPAERAGGWVLQSQSLVLRDKEILAAQQAAKSVGAKAARVSIALATKVLLQGRSIAYAIAAWVEGLPPSINGWAAQDLGAMPGQTVLAELLQPQADGGYRTVRVRSRLGPTLTMAGIGAEPALVPQVEGVTDAERVDRWDPPFPIDRKRITPRDEAYWEAHRAAPRLFLSREDLLRAWGGGDYVTGVWIQGGTREALEFGIAGALGDSAKERWTVPIRENAIRAAQGSTDMAMLVLALGAFVVAGALGLTATVFTLSVRQQARGNAVLSALGVPRRAIVAAAWIHGGALAVAGGLLGVPGGLAFGALALRAMQKLMPPDLGFDAMVFELRGSSILLGSIAAVVFALAAMAKALGSVGREDIVPVLRGQDSSSSGRPNRRHEAVWWVVSVACFAGALAQSGEGRGPLVGAGILCFGLGALAFVLGRKAQPKLRLGWADMVVRQLQEASPGVLLGAALSGMATFILCVVAGRIEAARADDPRLLVSTTVPLAIDLGAEEGRRSLGFAEDEIEASRGMRVDSFLVSPGDDVSCLNPAKPVRPRYLGVGAATLSRPPYESQPIEAWQKLRSATPPDQPVPALAEADTVAWTLQSGVGKTIPWMDSKETRFVGVLRGSPLAREILVPESDFQAVYPSVRSPSFFIVAPAKGKEARVARALSRVLAPLGPDIRTAAEELDALRGVQQVYMAIFLALGAFGLMLGAVGAAFVGLRGAAAHRSRYAILRALGLRRRSVAWLAVAPGVTSSSVGVLIGVAACGIGLPRDFAPIPIALVCVSVFLVLVLVNLGIAKGWQSDALVEPLRSE